MPFYQYSVSNKQGQVLEGTVQAANTDAARIALSDAGYTVYEVREQSSAKPLPSAAIAARLAAPQVPVARPLPPKPKATHVKPVRSEGPSMPHINVPAASRPKPTEVKTKKGKDKDLFFLFTQLGSYFRSGINPVQALNDLTARTPKIYHESMHYAAQVVSEGGRMSDAFEVYPYLYPPDVIGTIRAGETAGFLPEAMDEIAGKMHASYLLRRRLFYFIAMIISAIVVTPLILGVVQGSLASMAAQDAAGGNLPIGKTLGKAIGVSFVRDVPISLLIGGCIWAFCAWFNSMKMRDFRHRLIMRTPVLGSRAMSESMARFTWALGMISRGGLSPQQTFLLGLQSVPNLAIRKKLEADGQQMKESDKLSSTLRKSSLLPIEFSQIVETGEMTGDVPRALESVHKATDADYQAKNATAATRSSLILYGILAVLVTIICAWLYTVLFSGEISTMLKDT